MSKIIDLSHPIHEKMTTFPVSWHPRVEVVKMGCHEIEERSTQKITLGTHTGTHIDAPRHFLPDAPTIDQIPLDVFVGEARLLDLSFAKPGQEIQISDLEKQLKDQKPLRLILRFDWSDHWEKDDFYTGQPYLAENCGQWLVDKGIKLLGLDTPQADSPKNGRGSGNDSPLHKIFLSHGVIQLEYLTNLRHIEKPTFQLVALPLNILGADGAPARVIAIIE